ncbi:radical SAM protein [Spirochaetota bacterium]
MTEKYLILDCYVDEPTCLGVPPFISPYPRYIYGALLDGGINPSDISYYTIDKLRANEFNIDEDFDTAFLIGGAVVPGRYLGSKIGTRAEIYKIAYKNNTVNFYIGGLISHVMEDSARNITLLKGDIEKFAYNYSIGNPLDQNRSIPEIARWSKAGASIVTAHPHFPNLICEIETSRGCPRKSHCSFCTEALIEKLDFRDEEDIIEEVDELIKNGIKRFRIGKQSDILQYKTNFSSFKNGFSKPEINPLKNLFNALKEKRLNGDIHILNIDNANPGTIWNYPDQSVQILEILRDSITPGDTIALGIESFDPEVITKNNLKVMGDGAIRAIEIINEICGERVNGIPYLLPGINLIHGLIGETADTFKINYEWLSKIKDRGLLVKRINIRKVQPFPGTPIFNCIKNPTKKISNRFAYFKKKIRQDIDIYMLKEIYPAGTVLKDCLILDEKAGYSYGKQISSYSITSKYPASLENNRFYDSIVVGHRERTLISLPCPIPVNTLPQKALETIPGISKRTASDIILKRPFGGKAEMGNLIENISDGIKRHFIF